MFGNSSRKIIGLLLLIGGIIMTGMASPVEADTGDIRAAWVWQAKSVQDDGGDELLANAAKYKINRLYVNVDMNLSDEVYRTFISKASNAGIAVEALGGTRPGLFVTVRRQCSVWLHGFLTIIRSCCRRTI